MKTKMLSISVFRFSSFHFVVNNTLLDLSKEVCEGKTFWLSLPAGQDSSRDSACGASSAD